MEEQMIPTTVSYTDEDVANAAKRDAWAAGTYRAVLDDISRAVSKPKKDKPGGHLMLKCIYRVLKDPNDASSKFGPAIYNWLCLPFRNPNVDGHVPQKFFARSTNEWLSAHLPDDVIALPQKNKDGALVYQGEEIDFSGQEAARKEALDSSFAKAGEIWEDQSNDELDALKGTAVFLDLTYREGSDFPSAQNFRSELGEDDELTDVETALTGGATDSQEAGELEVAPAKVKTNGKTNGKNGKNGHAKPAPKVKVAKRK